MLIAKHESAGRPGFAMWSDEMVHAYRNSLKQILAAGALCVLAAAPALAADLDQPIFIEQSPEVVPVEIGSGWYIRGDVGYSLQVEHGDFDYRLYNPVTGLYTDATFATGTMGANWNGGVGAGYQFNQWFRGDITVEAFRGRFDGTTTAAVPCSTDLTYVGTTCRSTDTQEYDAYTGMANAYVDLGTVVGITPYVGAGIGYTYMAFGDLTNTLICVPGTSACPVPSTLTPVTHAGIGSARLTYSLSAGASYDVTKNTKLDFGYRYSNIEGGPMFDFDAASAAAGATGTQGSDNGLVRHDFRVGIRYALW